MVKCRVPLEEDQEGSQEESAGEITWRTLCVMLSLAFILKVARSH